MASRKSDEKILEEARARFKLAEEAEAFNRAEGKIDLEFAAGNQWGQADKDRRKRAEGGERPCLTFNKLTGPLSMISNEARMNTPGIEVHPVDMSGDDDTAEVLEGLIRHIEYVSKADEVYETALEQSARGGWGVFKVDVVHCEGKTFDQELRVERIPNQFCVYIDPFAMRVDRSDMAWLFDVELFSKEEYKQKWGNSEVAQHNFYEGTFNPVEGWVSEDGVRVARYWHVETEIKTLVGVRLPGGEVVAEYEEDLPAGMPPEMFATDEKGEPLVRDCEVRKVFCTWLNGAEVLDEIEWKGQWIPYLFVPGEEMWVENKRYLFSLIRFARDPQKLYNFYRTSEAEAVMLGTKAPWVGIKGAFRDPKWTNANTQLYAYLEYEPLDIAGQPAPPPQRNISEPPIQALSIGAAQAADDIKATTNVFDASLGARSNETSGIAIQRRQNQSGVANFHFVDNLNRAIRHCGAILADLIPKIYSAPRQVRILGEDRKQQVVMVNQQYRDDKGVDRHYDLTAGKYDVTITVGPSYTTQRQEAFETLSQFATAYPALLQVAGDLIFQYSDLPGAQKISERLAKLLPPALQEQPEGMPEIPPQLQAQMAQLTQQNEQLQALVQQQGEEIRLKIADLQSKEAIELAKIESQERIAALNANVKAQEMGVKSSDQAGKLAFASFDNAEKLSSAENIAALRGEIDLLKVQLQSMASGMAAEQSALAQRVQAEERAEQQPQPVAN